MTVALVVPALLAAAAALATARPAAAGGSYVGDPGTQATQRAGAFVARADDATALWHNPAGLSRLASAQVFVGANVVALIQRFTRAGRYADGDAAWAGQPYPTVAHDGPPQPVPMVVAARRIGRWAVGAGLLTPHGYGRRDYDGVLPDGAPAPQRYDTIAQRGEVVLPSVGAAVRAGAIRLGVRASWGVATAWSVSAGQGLPGDAEDPAYDAISTLDVTDPFVPALGAGIHVDVGDGVELGAAWTSALAVRARGTARSRLAPAVDLPPTPSPDPRCGAGGAPRALTACLAFDLPQTVSAGARWRALDARGRERADVEFDVRGEQWSAASDQRVTVDGIDALSGDPVPDTISRHGLVDVWSVRLGMSGTRTTRAGAVTARAGVAWDTAAAPASWRRLDLDGGPRLTLAAGGGVRRGRVALDLGGAWIASPRHRVDDVPLRPGAPRRQPDVQVPLAAPDAQPYHPFNAGVYETAYWVASAGVTVSW